MADIFFYQPNGVDIEPYPFDGTLGEYTAAQLAAALAIVQGVLLYDGGIPVVGPGSGGEFTEINLIGATVTENAGVADIEITGGGGFPQQLGYAGMM